MLLPRVSLSLLSAASHVFEHGWVQQIDIDSPKNTYSGYFPSSDPYQDPVPDRIIPPPSSSAELDVLSQSLSNAILKFRRSDAAIEDVSFVTLPNERVGLVIATTDGSPWIAELNYPHDESQDPGSG
ncbi:hypothetical protein K435DRAFT_869849 [Dendrothele bispora CBS 962.96]|uniref:Uncharacterized protein n=1 Tax=Dendrothele bispora (strain CBS 962.96) TaxID=1314807 RepID=A0A4S8L8I5_DENBC|nr:hypothetical protein K435DRAFT_869849 [Dendrothele bispora CBS 962.96]